MSDQRLANIYIFQLIFCNCLRQVKLVKINHKQYVDTNQLHSFERLDKLINRSDLGSFLT